MSRSPLRLRPGVEHLDVRVVMSATVPVATPVDVGATATATATPPTHLTPGQYPRADPNRPFTPADLQAYAAVYQSFVGAPDFTPQFDFNGTGFIGQNDATPILRGLASITPNIPLRATFRLAPGEQVSGHHPSTSGGVTRLGEVTILGKTTPNSIVFIDGPTNASHSGPTGNYKFLGGAFATDANGRFSVTTTLGKTSHGGSINTPTFLIRTPSGEQIIKAFPVLRLAVPNSKSSG